MGGFQCAIECLTEAGTLWVLLTDHAIIMWSILKSGTLLWHGGEWVPECE